MIERAKLVFKDDEIVIATSGNPQDDILETIAHEMGIKVFRGHEEDVVLRLYEAARLHKFDYFINITADCPLFGFDYIEKIKDLLISNDADLVTCLDLPHGIFTYGIKTDAFERVIELKKTDNTEVWGSYFYDNPDLFKVVKMDVSPAEMRPTYRLTIDYKEDFEVFEKIYQHFGKDTYKISSDEIVKFLDENPEVVKINENFKQLYQQRWESQKATNLEKGLE